MTGVRIRDANGNIILDTEESQIKTLGTWVVPVGSSGYAELVVNAPDGVDFTKNAPYIFVKEAVTPASGSIKYGSGVRDVAGKWLTNFSMPWIPFFMDVTEVTPKSFKIRLGMDWGAIRQEAHIIYGCV